MHIDGQLAFVNEHIFLVLTMFNMLIKVAPFNYGVVSHHVAYHALFIQLRSGLAPVFARQQYL